jgi:2-methylcitrate dehydratase PrpD
MRAKPLPPITQIIAAFVARTAFHDIPAEAIQIAKRCVLDGAAVMLAGSSEPCARIVRSYVQSVGGAPDATTLGVGAMRAPMHLAALANGVAGHALDWDDTALSLERDRSVLIHPTMQPLCAALAVGEAQASSGPQILEAFVLGFEVQVKIAEAIHPDHFTGGRGFHSSGTIGVFGSVVAASKLLGLSEGQIVNALAIAATMAAGLGVNHGTMSKPLNMGRAAETGVTAARLASLGFDGPKQALEGGRGFFEAFGGGVDPAKILGRLGTPWAILVPGTSVKPYPSGVVGHPGMDAMKALVTTHDIQPSEVESILVKTGPNVIAPGPLRHAHALTALEAKFCVPFQMAAMVLHRKAGLAEFSDAFVASDACQSMQRRVTAVIDPAIEAMGKDKVIFDITLTTKDGKTHVQRSAEQYRGGPLNPLTWDVLCAKFKDCAGSVLSTDAQSRFIAQVDRLDRLDDLSDLLRAACAASDAP